MSTLTMTRGDRLPLFAIIFQKGTSTLWDLAGVGFRFSIKRNLRDPDADAVLRLTSPVRIAIDLLTSRLDWEVKPSDLASKYGGPLATQASLFWDLQYTDLADPDVNYTLDSGSFVILPDVSVTAP